MHRCLEVPELLSLICNSVTDNRDLISLAQTCKIFKEPALDIIWHTLETLHPLIYCLPEDALALNTQGAIIEVLEYYHLKRNLKPSDYRRIKEYASRVRRVVLPNLPPSSRGIDLADQLLTRLFVGQQLLGPILPDARYVRIDVNDFSGQAVYPRLLIGSRLRHISIVLLKKTKGSVEERTVWRQIPADLPWDNVKKVLAPISSLQEITISVCQQKDAHNEIATFESEVLSELITSFPSLQGVNMLSLQVDQTTLSALALLPKLARLAISISTEDVYHLMRLAKTSLIFPRLQQLKLHVKNIGILENLIRMPRELRSLSALELYGHPGSTTAVLPLFRAIQAHETLSKNLEELKIVTAFRPWQLSQCVVPPVDFAMLKPLLSLKRLRVLVIEIDGSFKLNNDTLATIGAALPRLEVLIFGERNELSTIPETTITGLIPFFTSCPNLRTLTLSINALESVHLFSNTGTLPRFPSLVEFDCCKSPIKEPRQVATFLALLFPGLSGIKQRWAYANEDGSLDHSDLTRGYDRGWDEVDVQLRNWCPFEGYL